MEVKTTEQEQRFTKAALMDSKQYQDKRDILEAVLKPDKMYTKKEADKEISNYLKRKVK